MSEAAGTFQTTAALRFVDLKLEQRTEQREFVALAMLSLGLLALVAVLGLATKAAIPALRVIPDGLIALGFSLVVAGLVFYWSACRAGRRFAAKLVALARTDLGGADGAMNPRAPVDRIINELKNTPVWSLPTGGLTTNFVAIAAVQLARHTNGLVVRVAAEALDRIPPPLTNLFEATPLSDRAAGFAELAGRTVRARDRWDWYVSGFGRQLGRSKLTRHGVPALIVGILAISWLQTGYETLSAALLSGSREAMLQIACVGAVAAALILHSVLRGRQWLLVPGGVAIIRPRRWSSGRQIELYEARRDVLIYDQRAGAVTVATPAGHTRSTAVTPAEADLLLRAWQSPHAPPNLEKIRAFAAG